MLLYILIGIISIIVILFIYIRIFHKFWSLQPIFHKWDFLYYIFPPGMIEPQLPKWNKFCDLTNIIMINYNYTQSSPTISSMELQRLILFLQKNHNVSITTQSLINILTNHKINPFCFLLTTPQMLINYKKNYTINDYNILGSVIFRPVYIICKQKYLSSYFIDFLCINKDTLGNKMENKMKNKMKNTKEKLLQTAIYKHCHETKKHNFYLIKNEKPIPTLIPWIKYNIYSYSLTALNIPPIKQENIYKLIEITKHNFNIFLLYTKEHEKRFSCTITVNLSNLYNLIKANIITIYALVNKYNVTPYGMYIYKNTTLQHNELFSVVHLMSSIKNDVNDINSDIFITGFILSFHEILQKYNPKQLLLEDIADNNIIIKEINKSMKPFKITKIYIYMYNYFTDIIKSKNLFSVY
jgi:hypothetical protein